MNIINVGICSNRGLRCYNSEIICFNSWNTILHQTGNRRLRATWSPELTQDFSAFHNIDAEAELTALLSEQIAGELNREILRDIIVNRIHAANDILHVQPMTRPNGRLFYLDFIYDGMKNKICSIIPIHNVLNNKLTH